MRPCHGPLFLACRAARLLCTFPSDRETIAKQQSLRYSCRGDTRPARGSKLTLLSKRFARTVDGYHPSRGIQAISCARGEKGTSTITWAHHHALLSLHNPMHVARAARARVHTA